MTFADKLKKLIKELDLTQTKVSELTGISKPNISQYMHGKHEPTKERKKEIARALGVQDNYFEEFNPVTVIQENEVINLHPTFVAKLMKKSKEWVEQGLQQRCFQWGYAVKMKKWSYYISSVKFTEYTGIKVPMNKICLMKEREDK